MSSARASARGLTALFVALLLLLSVWGRISGHNWGDDFAQYIAQACNLAEGRPAAVTRHLWGKETYVGPPSYPNAFPLMLAPICAVSGLDIRPMMDLMSVFYFLFVLVSWRYLRSAGAGPQAALALAAILATNRWTHEFKNQVLSDLPGSAFVLLALMMATGIRARSQAAEAKTGRWLLGAVAAGTCFGFSYQLRTTAIALAPAFLGLLAWDALRLRSARRSIAVAGIAFLAGAAAMFLLFRTPSPEGYFDPRQIGSSIGVNLKHYWLTFNEVVPTWSTPVVRMKYDSWSKAEGLYLRLVLGWTLLALAALGLVRRLRLRGVGVDDAFFWVYLAMLLVTPFVQNFRYLLPLFPIFLLYVWEGAQALASAWPGLRAPALRRLGVVLLLAFLIHGHWRLLFLRQFHSPYVGDGPQNPGVLAMFDALKAQLPADSVIVFRKPRAFALYSGFRSTGVPAEGIDFAQAERFYRDSRVTYLLEDREQPTRLTDWLKWNGSQTPPVWGSERFLLYRFYPRSGD